MDKISMYDQYKISKSYTNLSMKEHSIGKEYKEKNDTITEDKMGFDGIAILIQKLYVYLFLTGLISLVISFKYASSVLLPIIIILIWIILRVSLNFTFVKANLIVGACEKEIETNKIKKERDCLKINNQAMVEFMSSNF